MAWTQSGNIKGASGAPGETGASGAVGATGATGASGASGQPGTTTWSGITDKPAVIAAGVDAAAARNVISAEYTGNKGQANGYAGLDSSGLVPSSQLPSFVDDVIEAANLAAFPATGESGKIYTALDTNKVYRWGGSSYTEISPSPGSTDAVPEGSTNLYYTAARADGRITAAIGSSVQAYSATLTTYAGKTAPSGAVVGTSDTQALTNKDLSGSGNTFPAFIKRSIFTINEPTTLASTANTDHVYFLGSTGDSSFSSVTALLRANGTNGSTTIVDESSLASNWTASSATLDTSQKKFGSASININGGYVVSTAATSNFGWGTGAFTAEFWMRLTNVSNTQNIFVFGGGGSAIYISGGTLRWYTGGIDRITSSSISANTWYHIAVSRSGTSTRLFIDGSQSGSTWTDSTNYGDGAAYFGYTSVSITGWIDDARLTKGVARYTGNFTAPTTELALQTVATPTLPSTAAVGNNLYTLKNISGSTITAQTTSSQTIDGSSTLAISNNSVARLISDGTNWRTL